VISGRRILVGSGSSGNSSRSISSTRNDQVSTPCEGGNTTNFIMSGHDPTIQLPGFQGEGLDDPEKNLFICDKIWETKKITDEDTKVVQLEITFRDCALDWYMGLVVNNPIGAPTIVVDVNKKLINEFQ
jgi:hypothetical protein